VATDIVQRRGEYGVDGSVWGGLALGAVGLACLAGATVAAVGGATVVAVAGVLLAVAPLLTIASYLYTTRAGKFVVWARLLRDLDLGGRERILDMGCGRGMVLLMAARPLRAGHAVGVDLWRTSDQSGNSPLTTLRNAELEGVRDRVDVVTADMRTLPFDEDCFDVVLSSLAMHNIRGAAQREAAVDEAVRVLRPGGRLLIADIARGGDYAQRLQRLGIVDVRQVGLGWRMWYGGPWLATTLVTGSRPAG
jgi:arsenite methyltransferase